jgi:multisubunit Na+/H+ antiporter MnhE subunit
MPPKLAWHCLNAAICSGLWYLAFAVSLAVIIALSPETLRQTKVFALVPLFLIVVLNIGAMLVASIRASRKVMEHRADPQPERG